jgi:uncharacterized protein
MFDAAALLAMRAEKDAMFKGDSHSPLDPHQRAAFDGLRYYPPNAELSLTLILQRFDEQKPISIQTTTNTVRQMLRYGEFHFTVDGQAARLTLYADPINGYYFLPFVDADAGTLTYGAGRYVEPEPLGKGPEGERFLVDFNQAYLPYCAYNSRWSCPITPAENRLALSIRAGEQLPGEWAKHS